MPTVTIVIATVYLFAIYSLLYLAKRSWKRFFPPPDVS